MNYVYILLSEKDNRCYIGLTGDLRRRVNEHISGKVSSTKRRVPLKLICYEAYEERQIAQRREKYLKSSDGNKDLNRRFQ